MKKYKGLIFLSLFFLLIAFIVYSIFKYSNVEKKSKITTIKSAYSLIECDGVKTLDIIIPIYINNQTSDIVLEKKVVSTCIVDETEENVLKLSLKEITYDERELLVNKEKFYCYCFKLSVSDDMNSGFNFSLKNAFLKLTYLERDIKIGIGSFTYYKVPYFGNDNSFITVTNLKGIINDLNNKKRILGIVVGIRNETNKVITISGVEVMDVNYKASESECIVLDYLPQSNANINDLLGYTYNYTEQTKASIDISINANESKYILIPIKSVNEYYPSNFGVVINYNNSYCYYLDNFTFFSTDSTDIGNLEILTYENK